MKSVMISAVICLLFLFSCENSKTEKQLSDSDVDSEVSGDVDVAVMVCDELEIKIPIKKDDIDVKFFPGEGDYFYRLDMSESSTTFYKYNESMEILSQYTVSAPDVSISYMSPAFPETILYFSYLENDSAVIGLIKESGNIQIEIEGDTTFPVFYNNEIALLKDGSIYYYDENLELIRSEENEQLSYDFTGYYLKFCGENTFLIKEGSVRVLKEAGLDRIDIKYCDDLYEESCYDYTLNNFKCDENGAFIIIDYTLEVTEECYDCTEEDYYPPRNYIYKKSELINVDDDYKLRNTSYNRVNDAEMMPDGSFNVIFSENTSIAMKNKAVPENKGEIFLLHKPEASNSFINGSGRYFLIDTFFNTYVSMFERDGTFVAETSIPIQKEIYFNIEGFVMTENKDEYIVTGGISLPEQEDSHAGMIDHFTGKVNFKDGKYSFNSKGTIKDETASSIEKTENGYLAATVSPVIKSNGSKSIGVEISILNEDLSESKSLVLKDFSGLKYFMKSSGQYIDLLFHDSSNKIRATRLDFSGNEISAHEWVLGLLGESSYAKDIVSAVKDSKIQSLIASEDGTEYVFSYNHSFYKNENTFPYFAVVKLQTVPSKVVGGKINENQLSSRYGDILKSTDGTLYTSFSSVDDSWFENKKGTPVLIFGTLNNTMTFTKTVEIEKGDLCKVKGNAKEETFYVMCGDDVEVYSKDGVLLAAGKMDFKDNVIFDDDGTVAEISSSYSLDGTYVSVKKRECGF
ncbi:MAG TPA: hypothetical protein VLJ60_05810 [bacterium]|nr:hypothetical protein [bacterium]